MTWPRFSHAQVAQRVAGVTEGTLVPPAVLQQMLPKTDGSPLLVEAVTTAILASGQLTALAGHDALLGAFSAFTMPATLHDACMARLDRLVTAKAVAPYAAVIGRPWA